MAAGIAGLAVMVAFIAALVWWRKKSKGARNVFVASFVVLLATTPFIDYDELEAERVAAEEEKQTEAAERLAEKERKEAEKAEAEAAAAAEEDAEQERLSNRTVAEALVEDNSRVHDAELSEHGHLSITMDAHGSWSENSIATNHAFWALEAIHGINSTISKRRFDFSNI